MSDHRRAEWKEVERDSRLQENLRRRLVWQYGPQRAAEILMGQDEEANRDLDRWNRLGSPRA